MTSPQPVVVRRPWRPIVATVLLVLAVIAFVIFGLIGRGTLDWRHPAEYEGFGLAFVAGAMLVDRWAW